MKKIIIRGIILMVILGITVFLGLDVGTNEQASVVMGQQETDKLTETDICTESAEVPLVAINKPIKDLDKAIDVILNDCSKNFIGGKLVDETFLQWIYAKYGEETVEKVADAVAEDEQDVNLWYQLTGNSMQVLWLLYCQDTGFQQYELENVYWKECASTDKIVLDFSGDINFDENSATINYMDQQPNGIYDCLSSALINEMQSADIMMVNNEFQYSTRGEAIAGKDYTFRADPSRVKLLEAFGVDIVNLANNHMYDYGEDALLDTLQTLREENIPYVGAGANLDEAEQPVYFVANGKKIAIVSATQIERSTNYTKEATADSAGVLKTLNPDKFVAEIKGAKANSDYVIVFVHWGTEGNSHYGADQTSLAKQFVAAGADAIIGGHTHCLQGIQYMDGVPIIYSLGNFWFSVASSESGVAKKDTGLSQVIINADGTIDFRFIPCIQKDLVTTLTTDEFEKSRILEYLESLSSKVSIDEDGYVTDLSE